MILAVDVGNTSVAIGAFVGEDLAWLERIPSDTHYTQEDYQNALDILALQRDFSAVEGVVMSSVVPTVDSHLMPALTARTGHAVVQMQANHLLGFGLAGYDKNSVGMDRLTNLLAAHARFGAPVMVVDMGTCTTVSLLDAKGQFAGGMIMPGVQLSLDAMGDRTAKLPHLSAKAPAQVIGKTTADCMLSGAIVGAAAVVDGLSLRVEQEWGCAVPVVLTGGMGNLVHPHCQRSLSYDPTLLLRGLYHFYLRKHAQQKQQSA